MPGVVAVYTGDDLGLPDNVGFAGTPEHKRPPFARGKVRFVGDIVAAVVAENPYQAADAAEAVMVDYDPLPAVVDLEESLKGDVLLFEEKGTNICFATQHGADVDALEGADAVAEARILSQRLAGVPMEPNGCVAMPDGDKLIFYVLHPGRPTPSSRPWPATWASTPPTSGSSPPGSVAASAPRLACYVEYIIAAAAARALGRPVKWTETRSENMLSMVHGRSFIMDAKLGVTNDGKFVGLKAEVLADGGAYPMVGVVLPMLTQMMSQAVYDIPKINFDAKTVLTNTTSTGAYRGAGRPEATQMVERIVDVAADLIGMDPAEIRRAQLPPALAVPPHHRHRRQLRLGRVREDARRRARPPPTTPSCGPSRSPAARAGPRKQLGIGLSTYVEVTAPLGLFAEYGAVERRARRHGDRQGGDLGARPGPRHRLLDDRVRPARRAHGQGPPGPVRHGRGAPGRGHRWAPARCRPPAAPCYTASNVVLDKARKLAAHLLEANADDIVTGDDGLQVAGVPAKALSWSRAGPGGQRSGQAGRPTWRRAGSATSSTSPRATRRSPSAPTWPWSRSTPRPARCVLVRHVAVDDCGRILNPLLVSGQQHGGIAQGLAQALYEQVQYDSDGNPASGNCIDYLIPSAAEMPSFETSNTQTDSPRNPLGAKGIGESGTIGSTPAVHNAVVDALSHLGVRHVDMPCTPEKVWRAIQGAAA